MINQIEKLKFDLISRRDFNLHLLFQTIDKTGLKYLTFSQYDKLVFHIS